MGEVSDMQCTLVTNKLATVMTILNTVSHCFNVSTPKNVDNDYILI